MRKGFSTEYYHRLPPVNLVVVFGVFISNLQSFSSPFGIDLMSFCMSPTPVGKHLLVALRLDNMNDIFFVERDRDFEELDEN